MVGLRELAPIGILLVVTGIALSVGGLITSDISETIETPATFKGTVNIPTIHCSATNCSITNVSYGQLSYCFDENLHTYLTIPSACNLTLIENRGTGVIGLLNSTKLNITYTQITGGDWAYWAGANSTISTSSLARWIPTIAVVVAAAVIIGILMSQFGGRRNE